MADDPFLSIVIPAFNEEERIGESLASIKRYLSSLDVGYEIIVVDDGSTDATVRMVEGTAVGDPRLRVLRNPTNRGKGYSVKRGVLEAMGDVVLFSDADLSTPIEELERFLPHFERGADVVIASRRHPDSRITSRQPWYREVLLGGTLRFLAQQFLLPGIRDSQCGFKCFRREAAARIFSSQRMEGFSFDIEVLFLAIKFGYAITEVGVQWKNDPRTRVNPWKDPLRMLADMVRIKVADWRGIYHTRPGEDVSSDPARIHTPTRRGQAGGGETGRGRTTRRS